MIKINIEDPAACFLSVAFDDPQQIGGGGGVWANVCVCGVCVVAENLDGTHRSHPVVKLQGLVHWG